MVDLGRLGSMLLVWRGLMRISPFFGLLLPAMTENFCYELIKNITYCLNRLGLALMFFVD